MQLHDFSFLQHIENAAENYYKLLLNIKSQVYKMTAVSLTFNSNSFGYSNIYLHRQIIRIGHEW